MLVVVCFSFHCKLPEIIWEEVGLRAEVVLGENPSHPAQILPHHVFAADLEGLGEVIHLLVLASFLEVIWFRLARPHDVPFGAVRANNSAASNFQRVHH